MKKLKIPRSLVLLIVFFIMFSILIVRLFQLQIVKGQEYENNFILQTKREIVLSGARGNEYYGAAEPPVRCGESHLSGLTEPPVDSYSA